jgi:hypothetical protein
MDTASRMTTVLHLPGSIRLLIFRTALSERLFSELLFLTSFIVC